MKMLEVVIILFLAAAVDGQTLQTCQVTNRQEGFILNHNDGVRTVMSESECQQFCLRESSRCRSYTFIPQSNRFSSPWLPWLPRQTGSVCYLSQVTAGMMGSQLLPTPGAVYGELTCPDRPNPVQPTTLNCSRPEEMTFERVMGFIPATSSINVLPMEDSTSSPTIDCLRECIKQGNSCLALSVQYPGGAAYNTPCFSYTTLARTVASKLRPRPDTSYFEKICLRGTRCNLLWTFERVPGYVIKGFNNIQLRNIGTKEECMEVCMSETSFSCRSAEYFESLKVCHLSSETRHSKAKLFVYQGGDVHYLENQCAPGVFPGTSVCDFVVMDRKYLPYTDRQFNEITDITQCQQACVLEQDFVCRSVSYINSTKDCLLSSCDRYCNPKVKTLLINRRGSTYSEMACTAPAS